MDLGAQIATTTQQPAILLNTAKNVVFVLLPGAPSHTDTFDLKVGSWTPANFDDALSPVALTAAFMADRYHTLREVKRQVGPLRREPVAAA